MPPVLWELLPTWAIETNFATGCSSASACGKRRTNFGLGSKHFWSWGKNSQQLASWWRQNALARDEKCWNLDDSKPNKQNCMVLAPWDLQALVLFQQLQAPSQCEVWLLCDPIGLQTWRIRSVMKMCSQCTQNEQQQKPQSSQVHTFLSCWPPKWNQSFTMKQPCRKQNLQNLGKERSFWSHNAQSPHVRAVWFVNVWPCALWSWLCGAIWFKKGENWQEDACC